MTEPWREEGREGGGEAGGGRRTIVGYIMNWAKKNCLIQNKGIIPISNQRKLWLGGGGGIPAFQGSLWPFDGHCQPSKGFCGPQVVTVSLPMASPSSCFSSSFPLSLSLILFLSTSMIQSFKGLGGPSMATTGIFMGLPFLPSPFCSSSSSP